MSELKIFKQKNSTQLQIFTPLPTINHTIKPNSFSFYPVKIYHFLDDVKVYFQIFKNKNFHSK